MAKGAEFNPKAWGMGFGIVNGVCTFLHGLLPALGYSFLWWNSDTLKIVAPFYPGLDATYQGAFMGLLWGAVAGLVFGWAFAWLHNYCQKKWC